MILLVILAVLVISYPFATSVLPFTRSCRRCDPMDGRDSQGYIPHRTWLSFIWPFGKDLYDECPRCEGTRRELRFRSARHRARRQMKRGARHLAQR
jgi:hypothetical protein